MAEFNLGRIAEYILQDHNCAGKHLTEDIGGIQSTVDTMDIFYHSRKMAEKTAADLPQEFPVITNIIELKDVGIFQVLVIPT